MHYFYLGIAIFLEVVGTSFLKVASATPKPLPIAVVVIGYLSSLFFLSLCLDKLAIGLVYAIWAGLGIVLVAIVGVVFFGERFDLAGVLGIGLIVAGVVVVNGFSTMGGH